MGPIKIKESSDLNKSIFILNIIWSLIGKKRKFQLLFLIFIMILSSIAELCSLASVVPFLKIIVDPSSILDIKIIKYFVQNFYPITEESQLLLPIVLVFGSTAVFAAIIRLISIYLNQVLSAKIGNDITLYCYSKILRRNYSQYIQSNSSFILKILINQIDDVVIIINFFLNLISSLLISIAIITTLFLANWKVALITGIYSITAYLQISLSSKKRLTNNSKIIANSLNLQIKNIQESLGSFRDVILNNLQNKLLHKYKKLDINRRIRLAENQTIQNSPKVLIEGIGLFIISLVTYFLVISSEGTSNLISSIGLLTLGSQRLLPSAQKIYISWTSLKANSASVLDINEIIDLNVENRSEKKNKVSFKKNIELKNLFFKYKEDGPYALNNINLTINKGDCIGIKGSTGSGKSTLVDLIVGLLEPSKGEIFVDNSSIKNNIKEWQKLISYVPQDIYLQDDTIANNIAFGIDESSIKYERLKKVSKIANLDEFVNKLPKRYETIIGEKGISLSGGQLQRIGIARALYNQKKILILDEATSALDNKTEKLVIDSMIADSNQLTILMVAHRLDSLKYCNKIIEIDNGKIKSYEISS